jgi:predicted aspartyl protease
MSVPFDTPAGSVIVPVNVVGPWRGHRIQCAVDTGATMTVLPALVLRALGYDLSRPVRYTNLRAATGVARAPVIRVSAVAALDRVRTDLLVAAHDFPIGTTADGLLGLDFFRGLVLKLDFARGLASLFARRWWQFWR